MDQATKISAIILACLLLITGGCATVPTGAPQSNLPRHNRIVAIGDVHGSYNGLVSIMREVSLIDTDNRWIGGTALLVQTGDLLDRGANTRQVLDLLMSLQPQAEAAGGKVVVLMLNNMPPTVDRSLNGMHGTLQLWAEGTMPDRQRAQKDILPPEASAWNPQMWDMRVFDNLINNVDRNQTNILIDPNWRLILIDHSRSFARDTSLPIPEQVIHCSCGLWYAFATLMKPR